MAAVPPIAANFSNRPLAMWIDLLAVSWFKTENFVSPLMICADSPFLSSRRCPMWFMTRIEAINEAAQRRLFTLNNNSGSKMIQVRCFSCLHVNFVDQTTKIMSARTREQRCSNAVATSGGGGAEQVDHSIGRSFSITSSDKLVHHIHRIFVFSNIPGEPDQEVSF